MRLPRDFFHMQGSGYKLYTSCFIINNLQKYIRMKKYLHLLLVVCFFAFSCKKDHHSGTDTKTYNVKFGLNTFTQSIVSAANNKVSVNSIKTNATPVPVTTSSFKIIKYLVFNASNALLRSVTIDSTSSNFDSITDQLPAGTYTFNIAAGQAGLSYSTGNGNEGLYYGPSSSAWKDTFFDSFQLTVSGDVNQNVTLSRMVAQLQLNIEDAIPVAVKSIVITVNSEYFFYSLYTHQLGGTGPLTYTTIIPDTAKGKTNFKINQIINNTIAPFSVTINSYDANQKLIGTGTLVTSVTCQKNTRTILSGRLYSGYPNNAFTVGLNNVWDPTPIVIHY